VRGYKVFAEAYIWRAAKVLSNPSAPAPPSSAPGGHEELFTRGLITTKVNRYNSDAQGYCYLKAFVDQVSAAAALGIFPTVKEVMDYAAGLAGSKVGLNRGDSASWGTRAGFQRGHDGIHHVTDDAGFGTPFWSIVDFLPHDERLGATQPDAVVEHEQARSSSLLTLPVRGPSMVINVPFTTRMDSRAPYFTWGLSMSNKVKSLTYYFESCEMESLTVKALLHKGDADSLLSVVAETGKLAYDNDLAWIGATHALHLSGNSTGGVSGELTLAGNHGFGTQLKGVAVGNPTPYLQAKLDATTGAVAYLRITLVIRVAGSGLPGSVAILSKAAPETNAADADASAEETPTARNRGASTATTPSRNRGPPT